MCKIDIEGSFVCAREEERLGDNIAQSSLPFALVCLPSLVVPLEGERGRAASLRGDSPPEWATRRRLAVGGWRRAVCHVEVGTHTQHTCARTEVRVTLLGGRESSGRARGS